jgi:hypothetical protein
VTYNDTYAEWDSGLHNVDEDPDYNTQDRLAALHMSMTLKSEGLQPVGLIYQAPVREGTVARAEAIGPADADVSLSANREQLVSVMESYRIY